MTEQLSRARLCRALGMFGEEYEQLDPKILLGKEEALLLISDALRCLQTRERAKLVLDQLTFNLDLTDALCDYQRKDPLRLYPNTRTDPYLARLVRAKEGQLNKLANPVKQIEPNLYQSRYVHHCTTLEIESESGEITKPTLNRSVFFKLGEVTEATTAFDFSAHMLGEVGTIPLCKALVGHEAMRTINLSWNDVRERSLEFIDELLEGCPALSSVDLMHNKFLAATAGRVLLKMVKKHSAQLRYLNIENCNIPAYFAKSIHTALGMDDDDDDLGANEDNNNNNGSSDDDSRPRKRHPGLIAETQIASNPTP